MRQVKMTLSGSRDEVRAKLRLEYLRGEIEAERISQSEIAELQSLAKYIEPGDVLLEEWAGIPENRGWNGQVKNGPCVHGPIGCIYCK